MIIKELNRSKIQEFKSFKKKFSVLLQRSYRNEVTSKLSSLFLGGTKNQKHLIKKNILNETFYLKIRNQEKEI